MIKACLNGGRPRAEHPSVPISATDLAASAARCAAAGAGAVHVHPRAGDGTETLDAGAVDAAVAAIRAACPGLPVGVSTGAWIAPALEDRLAAVGSWAVLPDFASVNLHEAGAAEIAAALAARGIGVEAGLWYPAAVAPFLAWELPVVRILIECTESTVEAALDTARRIRDLLPPDGPPVLLHGQDPVAWPILDVALRLGLDARIGLEDTLVLPDGSPAPDNAALVAAAAAIR